MNTEVSGDDLSVVRLLAFVFNFGDNTTLAIFLNYPTIIPRDVSHLMKPCPLCSCGLLLYVSLRGLQGPDGWHH